MFFSGSARIKAESLISYSKGVIYKATYSVPENIKELEENSQIIVQDKYNGVRKIDHDSSLIGPTSISQFEV